MAKFSVSFKIQALELKIEGERDSIPQIGNALAKQFAGLITTPQTVAGTSTPAAIEAPLVDNTPQKKKPTRTRTSKGEGLTSEAIDFVHNVETLGFPKQDWTTQKKSIWLLWALEKEATVTEASGIHLTATFNKHFRTAGSVFLQNVNRDLGKAKKKAPSLVNENTTVSPPLWFLTTAGKEEAKSLVEECKGNAPA